MLLRLRGCLLRWMVHHRKDESSLETLSMLGIVIRFLLGGGAVVASTIVSRKIGTKIGGTG